MVFLFVCFVCVLFFLFVFVLCFLFGLPLTILRSFSCLPEQTTVGAVIACTAWEKKNQFLCLYQQEREAFDKDVHRRAPGGDVR